MSFTCPLVRDFFISFYCKKTDNIGYFFILSDVDITGYAFLETDNIGIGIGIGIAYRIRPGQQSVIPIRLLRETIISVSVSVSVSYIG